MFKIRISFLEMSLWFLAVLMLLIILASYVVGIQVKTYYNNMLEDFAASLHADVNVLRYQQGYFKSKSTYEIVFSDKTRLEFSDEIIHGPVYLGLINQSKSPFVSAVIKGRLSALKGELNRSLSWLPSAGFIYQGVIAYDGDISIQAYLPPTRKVSKNINQDYQLSSTPLNMNILYLADLAKLSGNLSIDTLDIQIADQQFILNQLELSFAALIEEKNSVEGDVLWSLQSFEYQSKKEQLLLQNLIVQLKNKKIDDLMSLFLTINAREFFASNERFGPLQLDLTVNHIQGDVLDRLLSIQHIISASENTYNADIYFSDEAVLALPMLLKTLSVDLQSLQLISDLGDLNMRFSVASNGLNNASNRTLSDWLTTLQLDLFLSVDKLLMQQLMRWKLQFNPVSINQKSSNEAVATNNLSEQKKNTQQSLQQLVAENWLSFDKHSYTCDIKTRDGQVFFNQKLNNPLLNLFKQPDSLSKLH